MTDSFETFRRALEGSICGALLAQAYGFEGELVAPVTVLFLEVGNGRWVRFGIDGGYFHWRESTAPVAITADGSGHSYPLVEPEATRIVRGQRIQCVSFEREPPDGGRLSIGLAGGDVLTLVNTDDQSRIEFTSAAI